MEISVAVPNVTQAQGLVQRLSGALEATVMFDAGHEEIRVLSGLESYPTLIRVVNIVETGSNRNVSTPRSSRWGVAHARSSETAPRESSVVISRAGRHLLRAGELARSRSGRLALGAGVGVLGVALAMLAARGFADTSWPLVRGHPGLLAAAGLLFLLASGLKIFAWRALFAADERPRTRALAAATGGASVVSLVLPSRLGDAARVAIVRRSPGCPASVRALCLSLVMLGLVDAAALAPLAFASAALPGHSAGMRVSLAIVAGVGVAAAALVVALPRLCRNQERCCGCGSAAG